MGAAVPHPQSFDRRAVVESIAALLDGSRGLGHEPPSVRLTFPVPQELLFASAAVLAVCVVVHLVTIIYAVQGGLTAAEILARTRGSLAWLAFYSVFVLAVTIHAPIGLRPVLGEWKTGADRDAGKAILARGTVDLSRLDEAVDALCTKLLYTMPDCLTKTIESIRIEYPVAADDAERVRRFLQDARAAGATANTSKAASSSRKSFLELPIGSPPALTPRSNPSYSGVEPGRTQIERGYSARNDSRTLRPPAGIGWPWAAITFSYSMPASRIASCTRRHGWTRGPPSSP